MLDEREVDQRDSAYRTAFQWAMALLAALWVLAVADGVVAKTTSWDLFEGDGWIRLVLAAVLAAPALPTAVLAWRWRPPQGEDDDRRPIRCRRERPPAPAEHR